MNSGSHVLFQVSPSLGLDALRAWPRVYRLCAHSVCGKEGTAPRVSTALVTRAVGANDTLCSVCAQTLNIGKNINSQLLRLNANVVLLEAAYQFCHSDHLENGNHT